MYYIIYPTEKCNLTCWYCSSDEKIKQRQQGVSYDFDKLKTFIEKDKDAYLQMYGGEPLLEVDYIKKIISEIKHKGMCLQTNGILLDRLASDMFEHIDSVYISLDGPPETTDRYRGKGVYEKAIGAAKRLRERGYKGVIGARMTTTPGVNIYTAVNHFIENEDFKFDLVYWQLNMLFDPEIWKKKEKVKQWVRQHYNPQISRLIKEYFERIKNGNHHVNIIPFSGMLYSFFKGAVCNNLRCGAGHEAFAITREGAIFPCPVMRDLPQYRLGDIAHDIDLNKVPCFLGEPCTSCSYLKYCGGRCLFANVENPWDQEGFDLVCETVKHLVHEIRKYVPDVRSLIKSGTVDFSQLVLGLSDFEIIP